MVVIHLGRIGTTWLVGDSITAAGTTKSLAEVESVQVSTIVLPSVIPFGSGLVPLWVGSLPLLNASKLFCISRHTPTVYTKKRVMSNFRNAFLDYLVPRSHVPASQRVIPGLTPVIARGYIILLMNLT